MNDLAINFSPNFEVDPELKSAFERLLETTKEAYKEIDILKHAYNPVQSFMQTYAHTATFLNGINWLKVFDKPKDPEVYKQVFNDFTDLQKSAAKRVSDDQQNLIDTIIKDGKDIVSTAPELSNPQATAAKYMNKSLDAYGDVKNNLNDQAQTAMSIQAAYLSWYQQSLETLAK